MMYHFLINMKNFYFLIKLPYLSENPLSELSKDIYSRINIYIYNSDRNEIIKLPYEDKHFYTYSAEKNRETYLFLIRQIILSILNVMKLIDEKLYNKSILYDFKSIFNDEKELYHLFTEAYKELNYDYDSLYFILNHFP